MRQFNGQRRLLMKYPKKNDGLIQSGGSISANQIAVGRNASAQGSTASNTASSDALREVNDRLAELVEAFEAHKDTLANPQDLANSAESIRQEVSKVKPDRVALTTTLNHIANSVTSVRTLALIAAELRSAIQALF